MTDALRPNAFESVRPKGTNPPAPSPVPRKTNKSKAQAEGNVHEVLAMDRNGRRTVGMAPRAMGIVIEGSAAGRAATDRNKSIRKAAV